MMNDDKVEAAVLAWQDLDRAGDKRGADAAFVPLYRQYKGLLGTMSRHRRDSEECHAEGLLCLVECARAWDAAVGVPFPAYFRQRARWAMSRAERKHPGLVLPALDLAATVPANQEHAADLAERLSQLTEPQKKVAEGLAEGLTLAEIGAKMNVSKQRAHQIARNLKG